MFFSEKMNENECALIQNNETQCFFMLPQGFPPQFAVQFSLKLPPKVALKAPETSRILPTKVFIIMRWKNAMSAGQQHGRGICLLQPDARSRQPAQLLQDSPVKAIWALSIPAIARVHFGLWPVNLRTVSYLFNGPDRAGTILFRSADSRSLIRTSRGL